MFSPDIGGQIERHNRGPSSMKTPAQKLPDLLIDSSRLSVQDNQNEKEQQENDTPPIPSGPHPLETRLLETPTVECNITHKDNMLQLT